MAESGGPNRSASFYRRDHEYEYAGDRGTLSRHSGFDDYRYSERRPLENRRFSGSSRRSASPDRHETRPRQRSPTRNGYGSRARSNSRPAERIQPHLAQQSPRDVHLTNSTSFASNLAKTSPGLSTGPSPALPSPAHLHNSKPLATPQPPAISPPIPSAHSHKDKMPTGVDSSRDPRLLARKLSTNIPRDNSANNSPRSPVVSSPQLNKPPLEKAVNKAHHQSSNYPTKSTATKEVAVFKDTTKASTSLTAPALLSSLLENASEAAASRMQKVQAAYKAHDTEKTERRFGAAGKAYPAFVEAMAQAKKSSQVAIAEAEGKLVLHQKKQNNLVSLFSSRTEAQSAMVKQCRTDTEASTTVVKKLIEQVGDTDKVLAATKTQLEETFTGAADVESLRLQYQPLTERVTKTEQRLDEREDAAQKIKDHVQYSFNSATKKHTSLENRFRESEANRAKEGQNRVNAQHVNQSLDKLTQGARKSVKRLDKIEETIARVPAAFDALAKQEEDAKVSQKDLVNQLNTERQKRQMDVSQLQAEISRLDGEVKAEKKSRRADQIVDRAQASVTPVAQVNGTQPGLEGSFRSTFLNEVQQKFEAKQEIEDQRDSLIMERLDELAQMITDRDAKDKKHEEDMTALQKEYTDEVVRRKAVEGEQSAIATTLVRIADSIGRTGRIAEPQSPAPDDGNPIPSLPVSLARLENVVTASIRSWASSPLSAPPTPQLGQGQALPSNQSVPAQPTLHSQIQPQGQLQLQASVPAHPQAPASPHPQAPVSPHPQAQAPAHLRGALSMTGPHAHGHPQGQGQGHAQVLNPTQSQVQGNGAPNVLNNSSSETKRRFDRLEQAVRVVAGNSQAAVIATQSLDTRFNNLTTENIVQAMAHQFNAMYPFALTAQQDIAKLYREQIQLKQLVPDMERCSTAVQHLNSELVRATNSNGVLFDNLGGRTKQLEDEKALREAKSKAVMDAVSEAREDLTAQTIRQGDRLESIQSQVLKLEEARDDITSRIGTIAEKITTKVSDNMDERLKDLEEQIQLQDPAKAREHLLRKFEPLPGKKRGRSTDSSNSSDATSNSSVPLSSRFPRNVAKDADSTENTPVKPSSPQSIRFNGSVSAKPSVSPQVKKTLTQNIRPSPKKRKIHKRASYEDNDDGEGGSSPLRKRKS